LPEEGEKLRELLGEALHELAIKLIWPASTTAWAMCIVLWGVTMRQ
jgi:hypothetical protein